MFAAEVVVFDSELMFSCFPDREHGEHSIQPEETSLVRCTNVEFERKAGNQHVPCVISRM